MMLLHRTRNAHPRRWAAISLGLAASIGWSLITLRQPGYAQNFTTEEITNYATAVVAMEDIRRDAYAEISDLMTIAKEDVTRYALRCVSADGLNTLPRTVRSQVRRELIDYCNNAQQIVLDSGLTVQLFNSITVNHQENEELTNQIQSEIARLQ